MVPGSWLQSEHVNGKHKLLDSNGSHKYFFCIQKLLDLQDVLPDFHDATPLTKSNKTARGT